MVYLSFVDQWRHQKDWPYCRVRVVKRWPRVKREYDLQCRSRRPLPRSVREMDDERSDRGNWYTTSFNENGREKASEIPWGWQLVVDAATRLNVSCFLNVSCVSLRGPDHKLHTRLLVVLFE